MSRLLTFSIITLFLFCFHLMPTSVHAQVDYEQLWKKQIEEVVTLATQSDDWASTPLVKTSLGSFDPYYKTNELVHVVTHPPEPNDYALLRAEGVRTIISLDVVSPNQDLPAQYGISIFHVPMLPGEILPDSFVKILQIMVRNTGPYLIHAGPDEDRSLPIAALSAKWSDSRYVYQPWRSLYLLSEMDYPKYKRPYWSEMIGPLSIYQEKELELLPENLSAPVEPISLSEMMKTMGESSDALLEASAINWQLPPHLSDSSLAFEADKIEELSERWVSIVPDPQMSQQFTVTAEFAQLLKQSLIQKNQSAATTHWNSLIQSCQTCHDQFRDQRN